MRRDTRGSALLTTVIFVTIILLVTSALLFYASYSHRRATFVSRGATELSCAESGFQLARAYFANPAQQPVWNSFLLDPQDFNPVRSTWNSNPAGGDGGWSTVITAHPELFYDLDGDGREDVYIYARDNADETSGVDGGQDYTKDSDHAIYVGAVCISGWRGGTGLAPRRPTDGQSMAVVSPLAIEGLLRLSNSQCPYGSQHGSCLGNGNMNDAWAQ